MVGDILQPTHLVFVLVVALLVLGPKRLPEVGRQLGNGLRDFRAAINGEHHEPSEVQAPYEERASDTAAEHEFAHSSSDNTLGDTELAHDATEAATNGHEFAHEPETTASNDEPQHDSGPTASNDEAHHDSGPDRGHEFAYETSEPSDKRTEPLT
jgi:sec-independent protein translocase protein TatA